MDYGFVFFPFFPQTLWDNCKNDEEYRMAAAAQSIDVGENSTWFSLLQRANNNDILNFTPRINATFNQKWSLFLFIKYRNGPCN